MGERGFFIDRRLNSKDKSLGNRQRFLRRARRQIKEAVDKAVNERRIGDIGEGEQVSIPANDISEPMFQQGHTGGTRTGVFPENREYLQGDKIPRPKGGAGEGGTQAADSGEDMDTFVFSLTRAEFLDILFEDLELPDLVKLNLKKITTTKLHRAGFSSVGTLTNLNVLRTMCNSRGRRLALKRPDTEQVAAVKKRIFELEQRFSLDTEQREELAALYEELKQLRKRQRTIPFIDPTDLRFNYREPRPEPNVKAVMFCLMDVSGSMGEREKDLAKRFFVLLNLFLSRHYGEDNVERVFIRHTDKAKEVDEETFFSSRETGGTIVSSVLAEMQRVIAERYPPSEWNIYAAQASDGENYSGDSAKCVTLLGKEEEGLLSLCQYFAYVEITDERKASVFVKNPEQGAELWRAYWQVAKKWQNFAMKRVCARADIYPVFRELFQRKEGVHR